MVYIADSKSAASRLRGSNPLSGTIKPINTYYMELNRSKLSNWQPIGNHYSTFTHLFHTLKVPTICNTINFILKLKYIMHCGSNHLSL